MRPIDADALKDFINRQLAMTAGTAVVMNAKDFFENIVDNAPTIDAVPVGAYEQTRWERDMAISQLEEIGKSLCEKMDNVATVVRCKDCKHSELWYSDRRRCFLWCETGNSVWNDGYCSYGERREDG